MVDRAGTIASSTPGIDQPGPSTAQSGPTQTQPQPHVEIPNDFDLDPPVRGKSQGFIAI